MFRRVDRAEAARLSVWIDRVDGVAPWQKLLRDIGSVTTEYDLRYSGLAELWSKHKEGAKHAHSVLSFINELNRQVWSQLESLPEVYGKVDLDRYLVSFQDELYEGNVVIMEGFFRQLVVQTVQRALSDERYDTIVELGCGAGINLINLAMNCDGPNFVGCDLSGSAVKYLNEVAKDARLPLSAKQQNYLEGDFSSIVGRNNKWVMLTVHALEQSPQIGVSWMERVLGSNCPPAICIHLEPLHTGETGFAADCRRYAEINRYNTEFYPEVLRAEASGLIEILYFSPRVLGSQALNPTSVLVWRPKKSFK